MARQEQEQLSPSLFDPFTLPCGVVLKNRIIKSAMSDSLGDGTGHPTPSQVALYKRWADGGLAASIVGEVQSTPHFAEKPGNLVLGAQADLRLFADLAKAGASNGAHLWVQLGHAGAMAYPPISTPKGPSALNIPGLSCAEMTVAEIEAVPSEFARTAVLAQKAGFGGVQIHAAHGFLLSQFLSPLFNQRQDAYGGPLENRMRLLLDSIRAVRAAVGPLFPVVVKLNATDQLEGGFQQDEALQVVERLSGAGVDLVDISGGTYFPGAKAASDSSGRGPYFLDFAAKVREVTDVPLMLTGGFKTMDQASNAIETGVVDFVGLARAMAIHPNLPALWASGRQKSPEFPKFAAPPEGGITAWYTMRLTQIGEGNVPSTTIELSEAIEQYEQRDRERAAIWGEHFWAGP